MKENEKGVTLLEMSLSFVLLAILLESVWGFFSTLYIQSIRLEQQIRLSNEAAAVVGFIKQEIRSADKVQITTMLGDKIEVVHSGETNNIELRDQPLKSIQYQLKIPKTNGLGYTEKECEIILYTIPREPKKGENKLSYTVRTIDGKYVGTNFSIISEMIENIKVTRYKDSDLVEFTCKISKKNERDPKLIITKKFTESLEYKEHY